LPIRDAAPADCDALSSLAFVSKAHWGYDDAFMDACRAELTITRADLETARVRVAVDTRVDGFHGVRNGELVWMFVAPDAIGRGIGRTLLLDACAVARAAGNEVLRIEADPHAAAFYEHLGARRVGEVASASIAGRVLPLYEMALSSIGE